MHETELKCNENAMHNHITSISQHPTQKYLRKTQNFQKKNWKTPKLRSQMHEFMKMKRYRSLTKESRLDLGRKKEGLKDLSEGENVWNRQEVFCWEREVRNEYDSCLRYLKKSQLNGLKYLSSTKSWQM